MTVGAEKQDYKYHLKQASEGLTSLTCQRVQNLCHSQAHLTLDNTPADFNRGKYNVNY